MVIPPLHLRARRRLATGSRAALRLYSWLDTPQGSTATTRVAVVAFALVGAYAAVRIYPHQLPAPEDHPGFLATVFQSSALVFVGRIAILSLAAFAVLSIVARMWNRQWLAKAGPFEIEQAATDAERENVVLKRDLAHARAFIRELGGDKRAASSYVPEDRGDI